MPRKQVDKKKNTEEPKQKHAGGRPTKYDPKYCQEIIDYFSIDPYREIEVSRKNAKGEKWFESKLIPSDPPTFAGFAVSIDVNQHTLMNWANQHEEFLEAHKKAKDLQEHYFIVNGTLGLSAPAFTIFAMKNVCGWRDRQEVEHSADESFRVLVRGTAKEIESKEEVTIVSSGRGNNGKAGRLTG